MALPANSHKIVSGLLVAGVLAWILELFGASFPCSPFSTKCQSNK